MIRILVVDDDQATQHLLQAILKDVGNCELTNDGQHGYDSYLQAVKNDEKFDIVLLDLSMPNLSGVEFLALVREYEVFNDLQSIPIIVVTANPSELDTAMANGCNDYMMKPVDADVLKTKIQELVN